MRPSDITTLVYQLVASIYYGICWLLTAIVSHTADNLHEYVCETSPSKTSNLLSIYQHHLHCCIRSVYWILFCNANSSYNLCLMTFVFLRPEICSRFPSDSTSRWTPLPLANGWQLIAPITDLNRQIYSPCCAHTEKAGLKKSRLFSQQTRTIS